MQVDAKIAILDQYRAFGSMTGEVRSTVATVNCAAVYSSQRGRPYRAARPPRISESCLPQPAWTTTPTRTEQNLIARSCKSEAE